jgi:GH15 family glucan-1,4-alpha-glucosidase
VASGWHAPWDGGHGREMVPIQEDETALVLWALWKHYEQHRDIDFAHRVYESLVKKCANFMIVFRNAATELPAPSWNLWENSRGIHTFTCCTVVAGLLAAGRFAKLFAEEDRAHLYNETADTIVAALAKHLYSERHGRFLRSLVADGDDDLHEDATVDASLFALFYFNCFGLDDSRVTSTMNAVVDRLSIGGGIARFENDDYMRADDQSVGNVWFMCTLWVAEYYIAAAKTPADLKKALTILSWTAQKALPSGVLAEQADPRSGAPISVSPLTWSHSTFIATVHSYLRKTYELA